MGSSTEDRLSYRHSTPGAVSSGQYSSPGLTGISGSPFLTPETGPRAGSTGVNGGSTGGSMSSADRLADARARLLRTSRDSCDGNGASPGVDSAGKRWRAARAARAAQGGGGYFCGVPTNVVVFLVAIVSFTAGAFVSNPRVWRLFAHPGREGGEVVREMALAGDPRIMYSSESSSSSSSSSSSLSSSQGALFSSGAGAGNGVIVVLRGTIADRLEVLCAAEAYMASWGIPVTAVWAPDESVLQADFPSLFQLPPGTPLRMLASWPTDVGVSSLRSFYVKVRLGLKSSPSEAGEEGAESGEASSEDDSSFVSLPFFAPRDLLPAGAATSAGGGGAASAGAASFGEGGSDQKMGEAQELSDDEAMELLTSLQGSKAPAGGASPAGTVAKCFRRLQPSRAVKGHIHMERLGPIMTSYGVYVERKRAGQDCDGCKGRLSSCTVRSIAREYLRDTEVEMTIASEDPRDAANISRTFHPTRMPQQTEASQGRIRHGCQLMHQLATAAAAAAASAAAAGGSEMESSRKGHSFEDEAPEHYEESMTPLAPLCAQLYVTDLLLMAATRGLMHTVSSSPATNFILARIPMSYDSISASLGVRVPRSVLALSEPEHQNTLRLPGSRARRRNLLSAHDNNMELPGSLATGRGLVLGDERDSTLGLSAAGRKGRSLLSDAEHQIAMSLPDTAGNRRRLLPIHFSDAFDGRLGVRSKSGGENGVGVGAHRQRGVGRQLLAAGSGFGFGVGGGRGTRGEPGARTPDLPLRAVRPAHCICTSPPIHQLADHAHAPNTIIDKDLKIVYCSVEKVASTGMKMFIRSMRNLPGITNYFRTHTRGFNGLRYLWPHYKGWSKNPLIEFAAIRQMTRRDYLKFVFVRNPYTRVLSAYLDKEVMGDSRNGQENPKGRKEYNRKFFGKTFQEFYGRKGKKGTLEVPWARMLNFREFVNITSVRASRVPKMDHHLANQTDLCRLSDIKYDFVGHLETLEADLDVLLERLARHTGRNTTAHRHVFPRGQRFHNMKTDKRLLKYYEPDIVDAVRVLYKPDFNNTLNGIRYDIPDALQNMMQSRQDRRTLEESSEP